LLCNEVAAIITPMNKNLLTKLLVVVILLLTAATVASNYAEQLAIDNSKIPEDIEISKEFQRWITNMKKRVDVEADKFRLKEKNEVFNSAFLTITSTNNEAANQAHLAKLAEYEAYQKVRFSPNELQFLDFRPEARSDGIRQYEPNEVYFHGLDQDKIIDTKILTCDLEFNCFFDRGFFIDNHVFIISEFSRNETLPACALNEVCTYTIKLHVFDLINGTQFVYESEPYDLNLSEMTAFF